MTMQFAAARSAVVAVEVFAHKSGRTERMLASLKPGTRVVCASDREAKRLSLLARDRGLKDILFTSCNPKRDLREGVSLMASRMPTVVTHDWVQEHFLHRIDAIQTQLDEALDHISGVHLGMYRPDWPADEVPPFLRNVTFGEPYVG